ncbi:gustatory receptor for sugar taste 64f-like [Amyelois transitella]|uniref:gustatory receptor for sugar taste 64f-like n=1 Tax=Amyelois transitella TaxID=680683 RepID=UPI00298FE440|nr:gustatory receptor for sugar taste 64f-like [Amyelois transitella]
MCKNAITIKILAFVSFFSSTSITTILFIRVATKWPSVIREITNSRLDEYVDPQLKIRSSVAAIILLMLASFEYILSQLSTYAHILDCTPQGKLQDVYRRYCLVNYNWLFGAGVPYSLPLGILVQILTSITTINWNYSDIFIVCISLYLISIFDKINEKIESAQKKSYQPWFWGSVREDYTRATRLVRLFDDIISGITFVSFSNHLFFICLQLYNVLQNGVTAKERLPIEDCPNYPSGPFHGYEYSVYFSFSISLIICRFLTVSLLASRVHSAASQPINVLFDIPSQFYCTEIQRFVEEIHSDVVALSGLQFFHIKRSLILSVAGTIVTYELVLLQFDG